jgi:putative serine protease PepD
VTPDGPADKAGVKDGDVIVEFDGKPVEDPTQLIVDIRSMNPGDKVSMTVKRGSGTEELTITLGSDSSSE